MFDQKKYVNSYLKENYRTIRIRIRKDDKELMKKISEVKNINQYVLDLIRKDIADNRKFNYINNKIKIDFPLSRVMQDLVHRAEEADLIDDYGLYMNLAYAIDSQAKKETTHNQMTENQWNQLLMRYRL